MDVVVSDILIRIWWKKDRKQSMYRVSYYIKILDHKYRHWCCFKLQMKLAASCIYFHVTNFFGSSTVKFWFLD